jgi:outer membrane protein TolC
MSTPAAALVRLLPILIASAMVGCAAKLVLPDNEPAALTEAIAASALPAASLDGLAPLGPIPASVRRLDRPVRYLSLAEAIALALENGYVGGDSARSPGVANDDLLTFTGNGPSGADSIRVFALQPAIADANVAASLARFDVQSFVNQTWRTFDEPVQGLNSFQNGQNANLAFGLAKPLSTGGAAGLTWNTDYNNLSQPPSSVLNPSYFTRMQFGFEQPLLRDNGVFINQILNGFPSSNLYPTLNGRAGVQGILIARIRSEQQRAEFERRVNHLLLNVEAAYWNLYAAYIDLYSTDQALRMATEVWRVAKEQFPEKIDEGDFAGTRAQLHFFRGNRLQNIGRILDAERNLRLLIGLTVEDGERLVPIDAPSSETIEPDWHASLIEALNQRPELILAREEIKRSQYQVDNQLNRLQPDLRFIATYDVVGLGTRLDGNGQFTDSNGLRQPTNALRTLASARYDDWTLGLRMSMPLGFRAEFAGIRQAKLELAQAHFTLKEQTTKAESFLAKQYSRVIELADVIDTRRQQRQALADQLEVRFRKFSAGKIPVDFLQDSVRQWTTALSAEYRAVADYNTAIAAFHFGKGTLMDYDNVRILDGSVTMAAPVRAIDHERTRTQWLKRRFESRVETPRPTDLSGLMPPAPPQMPPELPTLFEPATTLAPPPGESGPTDGEPKHRAVPVSHQPLRVSGFGGQEKGP